MKRALALVAALALLAVAASPAAAQEDHGRTIRGDFCLGDHLFCISASVNGQTPVEGYGVDGNGGVCAKPPGDPSVPSGPKYCVPSGTGVVAIRPGTYWITVVDTLNSHNFELRSCPGSFAGCGPGQGSAPVELTPVCNDDPANPDVFKCPSGVEAATNTIVTTTKIDLTPGTYRLFCGATKPVVHENAGMYIEFRVGGVGQVGS